MAIAQEQDQSKAERSASGIPEPNSFTSTLHPTTCRTTLVRRAVACASGQTSARPNARRPSYQSERKSDYEAATFSRDEYEYGRAPSRRWRWVAGLGAVIVGGALALGLGLGLGLHRDAMTATVLGGAVTESVALASAIVGTSASSAAVLAATRTVAAQPTTLAMTVVSLVPVTVGAPPATVTTRIAEAGTTAAAVRGTVAAATQANILASTAATAVAAQPAAAQVNSDPCSRNQCNGDSDCPNTAGEFGRTHGHCYATCPRRCH